MERVSKRNYYLDIAQTVLERATCLRRVYGAIIVKNDEIISTGYNGAPAGIKSCFEKGECMRRRLGIPSGTRHELCYAIHAEQNAIIQAAKLGISIEGATMYCTHQPCVVCSKILINAGIKRIVYANPYPDKLAQEMLHADTSLELEEFHKK